MALTPCSRSATLRDSRRGIHSGTSLKIAMHILHVRGERARWTKGAGARDAHIRLRLHVGALRQQRLDHLQVAVFRGGVERRYPVLRRRRGKFPPFAIIPRPSRLPAPANAMWCAQARPLPPSFDPPPTRSSPPESACSRQVQPPQSSRID
jgi:hypothetical protein